MDHLSLGHCSSGTDVNRDPHVFFSAVEVNCGSSNKFQVTLHAAYLIFSFAVALGYCCVVWDFYQNGNGQRPEEQSLTIQIRVLQCWVLFKDGKNQLETGFLVSFLFLVLSPFQYT